MLLGMPRVLRGTVAFTPRQVVDLLQHLVGGANDARVRLVCPLAENHVDHFLDDADVRVLDKALRERAARVRAGRAGFLVNVSSFAGLIPQPDEAVYSATKAAVTAFSAALGHELAPLGIHVLAVHPVLVRTEMFTPEVMARMPAGSERRFISSEAFAEQTLAALARGERSVVIPRAYRWVVRLRSLAPERFDRVVARTRLGVLPDLET